LLDQIFEAARKVPFKVAAAAALGVALIGWFVAPTLSGLIDPGRAAGWQFVGHVVFPFVAVVLFLGGLTGALDRLDWRRLLDGQTGLASIRGMSWSDFENLVAEAYRRRGWRVTSRGGPSADGGVDLQLDGTNGRVIVQCKQWKAYSVNVDVVRALYGVMVHEGADRAILVTTGRFTKAAEAFAWGKPIELIDGPALERLVRDVQKDGGLGRKPSTTPEASVSVPDCPACGKPMVRRTARKGNSAGQGFWGCSSYPACHGTRQAA
jgi:restriction system protein